ncbi:MAG: YfiR family protein [Amphiplicatus sp.]
MTRRQLRREAVFLAAMLSLAAGPPPARAQDEHPSGVVEPTLAHAQPTSIGGADRRLRGAELNVLAEFIRIMLQFGAGVDAPPGDVAQFDICVSRTSDSKYRLSDLDGVVVGRRRVHAAVVSTPADMTSDCGLAFISKDELDDADYRKLTRQGVLTMSDAYDFARNGGVMEVVFVEQGKVAFFVEGARIRRTGLAPSSKFLRLATEIYY